MYAFFYLKYIYSMINITQDTLSITSFWNYVLVSNNFRLYFKSKVNEEDFTYDCINNSTSPYYINITTDQISTNLLDGEYLLYIYNLDVGNIYDDTKYTLEYVVVNRQTEINKNFKNINITKKYGR